MVKTRTHLDLVPLQREELGRDNGLEGSVSMPVSSRDPIHFNIYVFSD